MRDRQKKSVRAERGATDARFAHFKDQLQSGGIEYFQETRGALDRDALVVRAKRERGDPAVIDFHARYLKMAKLLQVVPFPCTLVCWAGVEQLLGLFDVTSCDLSLRRCDVAEIKITFRQVRLDCFRAASAVCLFPGLPGIFQSVA